MNMVKDTLQEYLKELTLSLRSRKTAHEISDGRKVVYDKLLFKEGGALGVCVPVYDKWAFINGHFAPKGIKGWWVVLDSIFRGAPRDISRAAVGHENVHIRYGEELLNDNVESKKLKRDISLAVNVIAYMETKNPFCSAIPYICRELRRYLNERIRLEKSAKADLKDHSQPK